MTDIQHILRKRDKQFFFQVELNWLSKQKGILSANDVRPVLQEVKENTDERATVLKMGIDSQYRLLLFLKKVI